MLKMIVAGAAGRMGRRLVANIAEQSDLRLAGAFEWSGSPLLGQDAGLVAGVAALDVPILDNMTDSIRNADAVIDFSTGAVLEHARTAAEHNVAIVIGTTALTPEDRAELEALAAKGARIAYATNYSIGVNLLFHLAETAVRALPEDFDIEIIEAHHNKKKDAPSGTAVTLAEILCAGRGLSCENDIRHGRQGLVGARTKTEIGMHSVRGGDIVGDHTVMFAAEGERIELTHRASSRDTFARGAIRAARFMASAQGGHLYSMREILSHLLAGKND